MIEERYEVSDGAVGTTTITGYFTGPQSAYNAFERAHGMHARGVALVYMLDDRGNESNVHGVTEAGFVYPIAEDSK